jgi:hypothetical protein
MFMQETIPFSEEKVKWPWTPEDITLDEVARPTRVPLWRRVPLWIVLLWGVGVITFTSLGVATDVGVYHHQLDTQASWISQASRQEATCLQGATTAAARTACAATLAQSATAHQAQFDRSHVAVGGQYAAAQMHSAYDALYAAACYNPDTGTADAKCLADTAPTLRAWAMQQADTAEHM